MLRVIADVALFEILKVWVGEYCTLFMNYKFAFLSVGTFFFKVKSHSDLILNLLLSDLCIINHGLK